MRRYRRIELVGGVLSLGAVVGWLLYALFLSQPSRIEGAKEQVDSQPGAVEGIAEPDLYGLIKSVDVVPGRITLDLEKEGEQKQDKSYDVAKDAPVLLDGPTTLAELPVGTRVGLTLGTDGQVVVGIRSEPFRITATPKQHEVAVGKPLHVVLRVTNVSPTPQSFYAMFCSWDMNWRSSNPRVTWKGWPCYLNGPSLTKLSPGETYEKILPMMAVGAGRLSFQMGFTPLANHQMFVPDERAGSETPVKFNLGKRTYWSREVILEVTEGLQMSNP
jgi:hypothetical protein